MSTKRQIRESDSDHMEWLNLLGLDKFSDKSLLDLGCGTGYICHLAVEQGAQLAVGVDILPSDFNDGSWSYHRLDLDQKGWQNSLGGGFNLVLAFDILEHLQSPYQFLCACRSLLAEHGKLILTTPNISSWERFARPTRWSGVSDPQHKILFNRYSLQILLERCGLHGEHLSAPVRKLKRLIGLSPQLGGQILCVATLQKLSNL